MPPPRSFEKGYQSTTLQDIIDATGLSKGAVYHHFRSKEETPGRWATAWGMRCGGRCAASGKQRVRPARRSFAGDRQQRMGRTLPHLTDDPYFLVLEWQSIEERLVPECIAPLSGRAWSMASQRLSGNCMRSSWPLAL